MSREWTPLDDQQWRRLSAMSYSERSVDDEMLYKALKSKREMMVLGKREEMRKSGPLYKPALVLFFLGVGSCIGGGAAESGGLLGFGVIAVIVSGLLNGINSKLMG